VLCLLLCCVLLLQHLPGLQHKQREFLVQHLGSPRQQQGRAEHLEQLVQQQQDAEETAM
jgi:truncated hemoglobin YjbI